MAYDRAPRRGLPLSGQTGPNVSPNSYNVITDNFCNCQGSYWVPFLSSSCNRNDKFSQVPGPDTYFPKNYKKITGGASMLYTASRFQNCSSGIPGPNVYDPFHTAKEVRDSENEKRLKGFMYHCNVPYTLLGYTPTIPNPGHLGYSIENGNLVKCCVSDYDKTLGPAYYNVNFGTFCSCYKGCFWSRDKSKRILTHTSDTPGVGTYDIEPKPDPLSQYLNELRANRKKNSCSSRYMDQLQSLAIKNCYPAPNQYNCRNVNKCIKTKRKLVPKRLIRIKNITKQKEKSPAPNSYTDPRTALNYLVKPTCVKHLNAFLVNAPRFSRKTTEKKPAPNEYKIASFVEANSRKISPYAVRNTAFDTSVPKKLYYLPPEPEPYSCEKLKDHTPSCFCRGPTSSFASKTCRFKNFYQDYNASCASYNITPAFTYVTSPKSFRQVNRNNFHSSEKRFGKVTNFSVCEDKTYIPGPSYDVSRYKPWRINNMGTFVREKRFRKKNEIFPGPLDYILHPYVASSMVKKNFNVSLGEFTPSTPLQVFRMKLHAIKQSKEFDKTVVKKTINKEKECATLQTVTIQYSLGTEMKRKK